MKVTGDINFGLINPHLKQGLSTPFRLLSRREREF